MITVNAINVDTIRWSSLKHKKSLCLFIFIFHFTLLLPIAVYGFVSADFNQSVLDSTIWTLKDPYGDAQVSLTGAGSGDAHLLFSVPAGASHDAWTQDAAPRLFQSVSDSDFEVEAKFDSDLTQGFQMQGIIAEEDDNNWIRFDFYSNGSQIHIFSATKTDGSMSVKKNSAISLVTPMHMLVTRVGDQWTLNYSQNGVDWNQAVTFSHALTVNKVGPYVGNYSSSGNSAPAHTAMVDYFFNTATPIVPEDSGNIVLYDVSVNTIGNGTVSMNPPGGSYAEGTVVELTAIPDISYQFDGWMGDAIGSSNPISVTVSRDLVIDATFIPTTTPQYSVTVNTIGNGTVTLNPPGGIYEEGTEVELTAVPDNGWQFDGWSGDINSASNPVTITVTSYLNLNATFGFLQGTTDVYSDDFNQSVLDSTIWTLKDPLGDAQVSLTGAGSGDAHLLFTIPAGSSHDAWTQDAAPRLFQSVSDIDFEVEAKFDSDLTQGFQMQGIIAEEDDNNWIRFDFYSNGSQIYIFSATKTDGSMSVKENSTISLVTPMHMLVTRVGNQWTLNYSQNGVDWSQAVTFSHALNVNKVGPYVGNYSSSGNAAPAHTAMVDYFFNTATPIVPEDSGNLVLYDVSVNVVGNGTVSMNPPGGSYAEGTVVELTAIPDIGYQFDGWMGDATGSSNPISVTVSRDLVIDATFIATTITAV